MVAIFQSQKRSMQADIDEHRELLSTLQVRLLFVFPVLCVVRARAESCHFVMLTVQLLDFLSVLRVCQRHPRTAAAASPPSLRARSSWSAVPPVHCWLTAAVPKAHDMVQAVPNYEHFLRLLTMIQTQGVLADTCTALSSPPNDPAACIVTAQSQLATEAENQLQHKLSRWPWSMMGKQVRIHGSMSHMYSIHPFIRPVTSEVKPRSLKMHPFVRYCVISTPLNLVHQKSSAQAEKATSYTERKVKRDTTDIFHQYKVSPTLVLHIVHVF
jgi:hypothetical protein